MMKNKNLKKQREDDINFYLKTVWNLIKKDKNSGMFNSIVSKKIGWLRTKTDHISEYAAEIGYITLGSGGEVFFTKNGYIRVVELNEQIIILEDAIEEEVIELEELDELEAAEEVDNKSRFNTLFNRFKKIFK